MSNKARVWLYKEGNECTTITGGWNISSYTNTSSPYLTKNSDHVYFSCGATSPLYNAGYSYFKASKVINLSYFNKMGFRVTTQNSNQHRAHNVGFYTAVGSSSILCKITNAWNTSNVTNKTYEMDISTYDSNGAPFAYSQCNDAGPYRMLLYEYYLDAEADIISISRQNNSLLQFSLNNLGNLLTFTQIDILANGRIIKTYNGNLTSVSYNFDRDVMDWGANEISIKATYTQGDNVYGTVDLVSGTKYQNNLTINDFFRLESQDDEKIIISSNNITDLIYINQVDILANGRVIQTYTENLDSITYTFDETLMDWGDNEISIQATYTENELTKTCTIISDIPYKKEVVLEEFEPVVDLPSTSTLREVIQRFSVIESTNKAISNNLKNLLKSKGFEVGENPRLSNMVKLVNELSNNNSAEITDYINQITALESEIDSLDMEIATLNNNLTNHANTLRQILINKDVTDITNETDLSVLINKVNELYYNGLVYLYQDGDECVSKSGGWVITVAAANGQIAATKQSSSIYLAGTGNLSCAYRSFASTANKININNINKIYATVKTSGLGGTVGSYQNSVSLECVDKTTSSGPNDLGSILRGVSTMQNGTITIELDTSGLSGDWHIRIRTEFGWYTNNYPAGYVNILKVWYE